MLKLVSGIDPGTAAHQAARSGKITSHDRDALSPRVLPETRVLLITCTQTCMGDALLLKLTHGGLRCLWLAANEIPPAVVAGPEFPQTLANALSGDVADVVVCGHSSCGLLRERFGGVAVTKPHEGFMQRVIRKRRAADALLQQVQRHVVAQLRNLESYPALAQARDRSDLRLHAWVRLDCSGIILRHDPRTGLFLPLTDPIADF